MNGGRNMVGTHKDSPTGCGHNPCLDRLLDAISNQQCRRLLYELREGEPMEIEEAAKRLTPDGHDNHQQALISLYHKHLPKLDDLGIIDYDQRSGVVRFDDPPEELETFLDLAQSLDEEMNGD